MKTQFYKLQNQSFLSKISFKKNYIHKINHDFVRLDIFRYINFQNNRIITESEFI